MILPLKAQRLIYPCCINMMHLTVAAQHGRPYNAAPDIAQLQRRAEVVADVVIYPSIRLPSAEHEQRAEVMFILIQPHPAGRIVECSLKLREELYKVKQVVKGIKEAVV